MRTKKILIVVLAILFGGILKTSELYANKMNAITMSKLSNIEKYSKSKNFLLKENKNFQYPYSVKNNKLYVNLVIKATGPEIEYVFQNLGCQILSHTKTIYFIKTPIEVIEKIIDSELVLKIEISQKIKSSLDQSKKAINADAVKINSNNNSELIAGEGVLVGVVDTGIDFTHPDFYDENGSRILKLWDMSEVDANGPEGYENYNWGKEYTKQDIDNTPENVKEVDYVGHGTHVAGIAAGGGKFNANLKGVAHNSDLLIVKTIRDDGKGSFSDADIIAACDYIIREAEKLDKPVVVNLSLGGILGSHDGKALLSLAISELTAPGVLFSIAAGNSGDMPIHAGGEVSAGATVELPILPQNLCQMMDDIDERCDNPNMFLTAADVWHSSNMIDSIYLVAYDFMSIIMGNTQIASKQAFPIDTTINDYLVLDYLGNPIAYVSYSSTSTEDYSNNAGNFSVFLHNDGNTNITISGYIWSLVVKTKQAGTIDMWAGIPMIEQIPFSGLVGEITFLGNNKMLIGSPADADSAISVGSFVTKNSWTDINGNIQQLDYVIGGASSFTSAGPSRDGRILPLISAPGQIIFSTKSKDYYIEEENILEGDKYCGLNGTSMAAPHVTGALALMLQVNPKLSYSDVVEVFSKTATRDNFTGNVRNNTFGFGKINLQAAIDYLVSHSGVDYVRANDIKVYPNPASEFINLDFDSTIDINNFSFDIYNISGERISNNISSMAKYEISGNTLKLYVSELPSGVYNIECSNSSNSNNFSGTKKVKFRFVVK